MSSSPLKRCTEPGVDAALADPAAERIGIIIVSALVAHTGWHWMIERGERLAQFPWPAADAATLAGAMRWLMAVLILAGLVWLLRARAGGNRKDADNPKAGDGV